MKDTSNYRTKTNFMPRNNGHVDGVWNIALDLGYSAVKLFAPNMIARYPSYAKKVSPTFTFVGTEASKNSIMFKNLTTDELWVVGEVAQNLIASGDTTDSEASLYGRERYTSEMFRVISEVGLGVAMQRIEFMDGGNAVTLAPGDDEIVIQTGLPEKYMSDEEDLRDALAGKHDFALKIADGEWKTYHFRIEPENVFVMSQPKGSLFSVCINKNGNFCPDAQEYLSSSVIVFDAGFGTLDIFPISAGTVCEGETYSDLGMKRILQETCRGIKAEYNIDLPVPAMQKNLATGTVRYLDKKKFISKEYCFGDILADATSRICEEAINRIAGVLNLIDYNYLIITGGTGAAWYNQIVNKFSAFDTIKIIKGNQNDDLPFVYSNVRGYYYYRHNKLAARR